MWWLTNIYSTFFSASLLCYTLIAFESLNIRFCHYISCLEPNLCHTSVVSDSFERHVRYGNYRASRRHSLLRARSPPTRPTRNPLRISTVSSVKRWRGSKVTLCLNLLSRLPDESLSPCSRYSACFRSRSRFPPGHLVLRVVPQLASSNRRCASTRIFPCALILG